MVVATEGISKRVGDLAWRQPQCLCNSDCPKANTTTYVCASNGKTYESECQMKLESCRRGVAMHIVYQGTCQSGTDIAEQFPMRVKCGNVRLFLVWDVWVIRLVRVVKVVGLVREVKVVWLVMLERVVKVVELVKLDRMVWVVKVVWLGSIFLLSQSLSQSFDTVTKS